MNILKMNAREVLLINNLVKLAEEAAEASSIIFQKFGPLFIENNDQKILVFETGAADMIGNSYHGEGYLTNEMVFQYIDNYEGGRYCKFSCDTEGIFNMLKSGYINSHKYGLDSSIVEEITSQYEIPNMDVYFRGFISTLKSAK